MKKTIEEAAERLIPKVIKSTPFGSKYEVIPKKERSAFLKGAEWYAKNQSEQMYSKEDMHEAFEAGQDYQNFDVKYAFKEWFNQFKKS